MSGLSAPEVVAFLARRRVAHLATADADGVPHVVPVCFAVVGETVYSVIDWKPKRSPDARALRRVANVVANPRASLVADVYDDADWSRLGFVLVSGVVRVVEGGVEHRDALRALRERYAQYREMGLEERVVLALDVGRVVVWGDVAG